VPWDLYCRLRDLPENDHQRMIYNHGTLVIMSPNSLQHERLSAILNCLILDWALERNVEIESVQTTTFRREDLQKGLEPDQCYYVRHASQIRRAEKVDLSVNPPPDLVLEVDVTSPSDFKLPIYASLGVPEVWIWRANRLRPLVLREGRYAEEQVSTQLLGFPLDAAMRLITDNWIAGLNTIRREFRAFAQKLD